LDFVLLAIRDINFLVDHDVVKFDVPVHDKVDVQIMEAFDDLSNNIFGIRLTQNIWVLNFLSQFLRIEPAYEPFEVTFGAVVHQNVVSCL
jgi:hypothetical protein